MWITLSIADLQQKLSSGELDAVRSASLANGQADPVAEVIGGVVAELRGRLRNKTPLEAGATIPEAWKQNALAVISHKLCLRLPSKLMSTDQRKLDYDNAILALSQLGPILPESPVVADTVQTSAPSPAFNSRTYVFDRDSQDGL